MDPEGAVTVRAAHTPQDALGYPFWPSWGVWAARVGYPFRASWVYGQLGWDIHLGHPGVYGQLGWDIHLGSPGQLGWDIHLDRLSIINGFFGATFYDY